MTKEATPQDELQQLSNARLEFMIRLAYAKGVALGRRNPEPHHDYVFLTDIQLINQQWPFDLTAVMLSGALYRDPPQTGTDAVQGL